MEYSETNVIALYSQILQKNYKSFAKYHKYGKSAIFQQKMMMFEIFLNFGAKRQSNLEFLLQESRFQQIDP